MPKTCSFSISAGTGACPPANEGTKAKEATKSHKKLREKRILCSPPDVSRPSCSRICGVKIAPASPFGADNRWPFRIRSDSQNIGPQGLDQLGGCLTDLQDDAWPSQAWKSHAPFPYGFANVRVQSEGAARRTVALGRVFAFQIFAGSSRIQWYALAIP